MPLRTFVILAGLFGICIAIVVVAWMCGSEFYVFLPSRRITSISTPPTDPIVVLVLLAACLALYLYSQRYALFLFTTLLGGLLLGSLVGYGVYHWAPTIPQILLTLAVLAETVYGWMIQGEVFDE